MNPSIHFKTTSLLLLIALVLACFGLSPMVQATDLGSVLPNGNTADGFNALISLTTGSSNSAFGYQALFLNTTGNKNTAIGEFALYGNNTAFNVGSNNTATGYSALSRNSSGLNNTATGSLALFNNSTGSYNTANGAAALQNNIGGSSNTADGRSALRSNTSGTQNTATGYGALSSNSTGGFNTATGGNALLHSTGSNNVGLGYNAGSNLTTGSGNVCIGSGIVGVAGESNTTRIKNVYSSVASGRIVYVNSDNKLGTLASSRRFKEEIKPIDKASETLFALKPVTFRYKKDIDASQALSFGLIAEDVAEINANLITRDEDGNPQTVRYDAVNAMLLNEFLKEHRTVKEQQKEIDALRAELKEQRALIQKVNDKVELYKPAPQMAANP